tara:strand:- start:21 stop:644 length:624 start_codon:yes stop_codon:yes gene_type:complete
MSELLLNSTTAHNVDQREPIVRVEHAALTCGAVECRQYGPGHENFVANTSSVIWACGRLLPEHLCREPELVAGKRVCELGAGIGLAGVTACALGATDVLITDCREAMPLLQMNVEQNAGRVRGTLRAQELLWGDTTRIEAAGRRSYDVLLGADIVYHQSPEVTVRSPSLLQLACPLRNTHISSARPVAGRRSQCSSTRSQRFSLPTA